MSIENEIEKTVKAKLHCSKLLLKSDKYHDFYVDVIEPDGKTYTLTPNNPEGAALQFFGSDWFRDKFFLRANEMILKIGYQICNFVFSQFDCLPIAVFVETK